MEIFQDSWLMFVRHIINCTRHENVIILSEAFWYMRLRISLCDGGFNVLSFSKRYSLRPALINDFHETCGCAVSINWSFNSISTSSYVRIIYYMFIYNIFSSSGTHHSMFFFSCNSFVGIWLIKIWYQIICMHAGAVLMN